MAVLRAGASLKNGTFVVASILGRGGFGEVYLARQPRMDRDIAIKVLSPSVAEEADVVRRFEREALAAGSLLHPNVLPVFDFDFDEESGVWFLAMQYIPGGRTLQSLLGKPIDPVEVARIITAVASALDAAHERGIIHRDVKPANVLMDGNRPMLTDFGIAHLGSMTGITARGMAIGTPAYISPEQGMGKMVGPQADQYSLAVMTYHMLAGRPPFTGDSLSLVMQHVSNPPPALTTLNPDLPAGIGGVVAKALSKAPEERYTTCADFAAALSAAAGMLPTASGSTAIPTSGADMTVAASGSVALPQGSAASLSVGGYAPDPTVRAELGQPNPLASAVASAGGVRQAAASASGIGVPAKSNKPLIMAALGVVVLLSVAGLGVKQFAFSSEAAPAATALPGGGGIGGGAPPTSAAVDPDRGVVMLASSPLASVVVNDEPAGRTPAELRLRPGEHDLKLVASTFEEWTTRVKVEAGQRLTVPPVDMVPLPASEVIAVTDSKLGRDPFLDAAGLVRLATTTDTFRVNDDINAVAYVNPRTFGIRDLSFDIRWEFQRAGAAAPGEASGHEDIPRTWQQTFLRFCLPASAADSGGSNAPLNINLFIEGKLVQTFTFRVQPGPITGQTDCGKTVLPDVQAPA